MSTDTFKTLLIGIDADGRAAEAVERGADLARKLDARLHLLHAVEVPPPLWLGIDDEQLAAMHASALAHARERVLETYAELSRDVDLGGEFGDLLDVHPGHPAKVFLDHARDLQADLLMLGAHAKRSLFEFGSTTRTVLARAERPLWLQPGPVEPIRRILAPFDLSVHGRGALRHARDLAERLGARLRVLHCYTAPSFSHTGIADAIGGQTSLLERDRAAARAELDGTLREFEWGPVEVDSDFLEGKPDDVILREAAEAELVVMGTHGRTGLARTLVGSVAYSVSKQLEKPILMIPNPSRAWLLTDDGGAAKG